MLLILLALVLGGTAVGVAAFVPQNVWDAVAERIRSPRPSALEELHRHLEAQSRLRLLPPEEVEAMRDDD